MSVFRIGTAAGGRLLTASVMRKPGSNSVEYNIAQGENTRMIYNLIKEQNYKEAKSILESKLSTFPRSRAALSLLGYCCYHLEEYEEAVSHYEKLVEIFAKQESYRLSLVQSYYKSAQYQKAIEAGAPLMKSTDFSVQQQVKKILTSCYFEQKDFNTARKYRSMGVKNDPDIQVMKGCLLYQDGEIRKALNTFQKALQLQSKPSIAYNIAVCLFQLKQFKEAQIIVDEIIQKGAEMHPELGVGTAAAGMDIRSVGNSVSLRNTSLIETFNLKLAMYLMEQNMKEAEHAYLSMPPRNDDELDAVTLHNKALINMEKNPSEGINILKHLLANPPFPEETFANLLLVLCQFSYYSHAGDVLADNDNLVNEYLAPELWEFLNHIILAQTSPVAGLNKLDKMATSHVQRLRKKLSECRRVANMGNINVPTDAFQKLMKEYEELLQDYIPVLMHMARIYWELSNYPEVERILKEVEELCKDDMTWKLNLAHSHFMQNSMDKFMECTKYYVDIVEKNTGSLLSIPPMILANLCTAFIMTNQNEDAEEVMRKIEREEMEKTRKFPNEPALHLCIVNLVIGTLYCSKGHFEFGISRVIRSLEPYKTKLSTDTWFYSKRCFLALAESLTKHMVIITDAFFEEILTFLRNAERYGKNIRTRISSKSSSGADGKSMSLNTDEFIGEDTGIFGSSGGDGGSGGGEGGEGGNVNSGMGKNTVFHEARVMRMIYLRIREEL